jgi:putative transposase
VVGPQAKRKVVRHICSQHGLSQRRACGLTRVHRSTYRYEPKGPDKRLEVRLIELATAKVSYGYRRLHQLLLREGYTLNHKKVYLLYKKNGLAKRKKKKKRYKEKIKKALQKVSALNERWAMDFMSDSCSNGRKIRTLNILDLFGRECLRIEVGSSLPSRRVISVLEELELERGLPKEIIIDNGTEYTSKLMQIWAKNRGVTLCYITPGKPMENGYIESFNGKFREECLNQNWFKNISEASILIENWRQDYNKNRPHSALGYLTPYEYIEKNKNNQEKV